MSLCNAKGPVKTMNAKRKEVYEQLKRNNPKFVVLHTEYASMHFLMLNSMFKCSTACFKCGSVKNWITALQHRPSESLGLQLLILCLICLFVFVLNVLLDQDVKKKIRLHSLYEALK